MLTTGETITNIDKFSSKIMQKRYSLKLVKSLLGVHYSQLINNKN